MTKYSSFLEFALIEQSGGILQPFYLQGAFGKCSLKMSLAWFAELYPDREVWATEMRLKAVSLVTYLAF